MCLCITEIRCQGLQSASTNADCTYEDEYVSCLNPVLPRTRAILSCRTSYRQDTTLFSRSQVTCNKNGQWQPDPIRCIPGPLNINIYVNNSSVSLQTDVQINNSTFVEIFDDKIVIYRNKKENIDSDIDIRIGRDSKNRNIISAH